MALLGRFFLLSSMVVLSLSCTQTIDPQDRPGKITVKGYFPEVARAQESSYSSRVRGTRSYTLDPAMVSKVIAYSGSYRYEIADVTNGAFNISVDADKPTGLVFTGPAGENLGYLSLQNGIESLPLMVLDDSVTAIDLQALYGSGNIIEPGHNPVGAEIVMSTSDITSYAFSNSGFASMLRSPDIDGDGIVDVLSGLYYRYFIQYGVRAGVFTGTNLTATMANPVLVDSYRFSIQITDPEGGFPAAITYNAPEESGLNGLQSEGSYQHGATSMLYGSQPMQTNVMAPPVIPPAGVYRISYKTRTLTFNLPDQSDIIKYQAISVPTVTLNGDGTINKLNWEYALSDGSGTIDPRVLISSLMVQIDRIGNTRAYDSPWLQSSTTEHILSNQSILWSEIGRIYMAYEDIFGNHIVVTWDKI